MCAEITRAPDWETSEDGRSWPSSAVRMGPAWQAAWDLLADGQWHARDETVDAMLQASDIVAKTARKILGAARRAKFIQSRSRHGKRRDRRTDLVGASK